MLKLHGSPRVADAPIGAAQQMPEESQNPQPSPARSYNSEPSKTSRLAMKAAEDAALLSRVEQGDQEAMGLLFDRYSGIVYSVALRVLKDTGQAEDVMQEIFIQIWKKSSAFVSGRGSLGAWLMVVARNRAIDSLRRRRPSDSVDDVVLTSSTDLAAEAERNTLMERVRAYMHQLPPEQRKSVEMAYFEGLSHSEIAEKTGDPLGTVKTRIRLALITLRKAMQGRAMPGDPTPESST
jgi:RNA polymerase sigma-70 factor, ECF subfamily